MLVYNKLYEARILLRLSQQEVANVLGVNQGDISLLESGKRVFIPTEYLCFLASKGINLNDLFNESVPVEQFGKVRKVEKEECGECQLKDKLIMSKEETILAMKLTIETLNLKYEGKRPC